MDGGNPQTPCVRKASGWPHRRCLPEGGYENTQGEVRLADETLGQRPLKSNRPVGPVRNYATICNRIPSGSSASLAAIIMLLEAKNEPDGQHHSHHRRRVK